MEIVEFAATAQPAGKERHGRRVNGGIFVTGIGLTGVAPIKILHSHTEPIAVLNLQWVHAKKDRTANRRMEGRRLGVY